MKVVILRGLPGSGKSHYAAKLGREEPARRTQVFSADHFFLDEAGVYRFDRSKLGLAHGTCLRNFTNALVFSYKWPNDSVLVVDNTNTTGMEVAPYAQLAIAYGAELEVVTIACNSEVAFERQTHGVPKSAHNDMCRRLTSKLPAYWPQRTIGERRMDRRQAFLELCIWTVFLVGQVSGVPVFNWLGLRGAIVSISKELEA